MVNNVRRPRIEGTFAGERMRAFDVVWGTVTGRAVIENTYADVTSGVIVDDGSRRCRSDGRFSLGFPRRDARRGDQRAHPRHPPAAEPTCATRSTWTTTTSTGCSPASSTSSATTSTPFGFGQMAIVEGVAYGEPFETATAARASRRRGRAARLAADRAGRRPRARARRGSGWNGTYSFNLDGRGIPARAASPC